MKRIYLDTNVWLYAYIANKEIGELHQTAQKKIHSFIILDYEPVLSQQVIREFVKASFKYCKTDEEHLGMLAIVKEITNTFMVLPDTHKSIDLFTGLIRDYKIRHKKIFDANHVATMLANGVTEILTNDSDFMIFQDQIKVHKLF